jgi:hypothetical protein
MLAESNYFLFFYLRQKYTLLMLLIEEHLDVFAHLLAPYPVALVFLLLLTLFFFFRSQLAVFLCHLAVLFQRQFVASQALVLFLI